MTQWGLDTLFNPAKRHMDDEKRRLQSTREEVGDNSGGKRIDLESGKVVIRKADDGATDPAEDDATSTEGPASEKAGTENPESTKPRPQKPAKGEPSAAAIRAAKRRGRTLG